MLTPTLDNSTETYTDSTGVDLEEFIKKTLNKNPKDRQMLYGLEHDLTDFINDTGYNIVNSYVIITLQRLQFSKRIFNTCYL